jgi:hypothetical protein
METQQNIPWRLNPRDVLELNDFWARRPKHVALYFEIEEQNGLWSLLLKSNEKEWHVGYYIDGNETRRLLYGIKIRRRGEAYYSSDIVMREINGEVVIALPHINKPRFVIKFPVYHNKARQ